MDERQPIDEAKFPAAGKGMEWGEKEPVAPETLPSFVEKLKRDEGMFVLATYTRMTWFDRKAWEAWERTGKLMIKVAKDGRNFWTLEGRGVKYVFTQPTSIFWLPRQPVEESMDANDMRSWIDRCAGIEVAAVAEAVRPLGGLDVAAADDEVQIHFESAADAQLVYDFLIGAGTGVRLLEPGEVQLRVIEGWDQCTVAFAPHVRYLKPEIIAAVLEAFADRIHEAAWDAAQRDLAEEVQALQEFNPYHDKQGNFGSKAGLAAAKAGSYSKGSRKNKVSGKTKKGLKLVATKLPCGRDARDSGRNQRCWDGAKLDWTGQAAARVLKKAKAQGKIHDAVTAYDRAILERAARALDARAAMMDEAAGAKKLRTAVSTAYNKYFENVPVDIFAIGKIGKEIEALIVAGKDLDAEMPAIVKKYRKEESDGRSVRDLLSELGGQTFGGRRGGRDPYWMAAKYAGKDKNGTPFRKGDQVFYYPNTKTVLAGDAAEKAAAEFQGAKDDERQYNYGME
jgi:hypothetical protein